MSTFISITDAHAFLCIYLLCIVLKEQWEDGRHIRLQGAVGQQRQHSRGRTALTL